MKGQVEGIHTEGGRNGGMAKREGLEMHKKVRKEKR